MDLTVLGRPVFACSPVRGRRAAFRQLRQPITAANFTTNSVATEKSKVCASSGSLLQRSAPLATRREQLAILAAGTASAILGLTPRITLAEEAPSSPSSRALEAIRRDFVDRQYYVTGDLSPELFAPDCLFKDPTVEVVGVEPYVRALQTLFDPATSRADLISIAATGPNTVDLRWRLEGSLKVGGLKIKPYTGTTVYTISDDGKVVRHEETWDISTLDAFVSTFLPGFGAPPAPPVAPAK